VHPDASEPVSARPVALLVNGPSSSGKSTLCRALQERLNDGAGDDATFASVAFDDLVRLISDTLFPISFVALAGGDVTRLVSREPHDGRAAWEYVHETATATGVDGHPRVRVVLRDDTRRLLSGIHRGWGAHLTLGTNLIIDHFLQDKDWCDETLDVLENSGAHIFSVGVYCSVQELERREAARADGELEGRPLGLARRSNELCHSHGIEYDVTVWTDQQSTEQSVDAIIAALYSLPNGVPRPRGNS